MISKRWIHFFLWISFIWGEHFSSTVLAKEPVTAVDQLIKQATEQQLAQHPYWLRLLHYSSPEESDIQTPSFFFRLREKQILQQSWRPRSKA